jgi:hypothetical protein
MRGTAPFAQQLRVTQLVKQPNVLYHVGKVFILCDYAAGSEDVWNYGGFSTFFLNFSATWR